MGKTMPPGISLIDKTNERSATIRVGYLQIATVEDVCDSEECSLLLEMKIHLNNIVCNIS